MLMFQSEVDLVAVLDHHDNLVRQCARGELSYSKFSLSYNNFFWRYALDGHESDDEERALLAKYAERIAPHRTIASEILGLVCSAADAERKTYKQAGRFGSAEALARLGRAL